jgi:hypothetical protein
MADDSVQIPTGELIDTTKITRADATVVERQRVVIASDTNQGEIVSVDGGRLQVSSGSITGLLQQLIKEVRDLKLALLDQLH